MSIKDAIMAKSWTDVKGLKIQLSGAQDAGSFYGNGRNQIAVIVTFVPIDGAGATVKVPTKKLRDSVSLVDFVSGSPLSTTEQQAGWFYSSKPNRYLVSPESRLEAAAERAKGAVSVMFYVTCGTESAPRIASIAASVKPTDASRAKNSALNGGAESKVTLTAFEAFIYTVSHMGWDVESKEPAGLIQRNYHLAIATSPHGNDGYILHADISGFIFLPIQGNRLYSFFSVPYLSAGASHVGYVWPMDGPDTAVVLTTGVTIETDTRPHQVALTGVMGPDLDTTPYSLPLRIVIVDQYGNSGTFHVGHDSSFLAWSSFPLDGVFSKPELPPS
jgi:hypothetical protein